VGGRAGGVRPGTRARPARLRYRWGTPLAVSTIAALLGVTTALTWPMAAWGLGGGSPAATSGLSAQPEGSASSTGPAAPQGTVTVAISPASGLADGQTVQVSGSGFAAGSQIALGECRTGATSVADCTVAGALIVTADASGGFITPFTVSRVITIGASTIDCSTPGACVIAAGQLPNLTTFATGPISFLPASPPAPPPPSTSSGARYYLALGDSLATGFGAPTGQGYVDDLEAHYAASVPGLQEVDIGCAGETTTTFLSGGHCPYEQGSQLAAAEAFLTSHQGQVAFVTIDIGGDDITGCATTAPSLGISESCVDTAVAQVTANLATIGAGLRSAAGPSVPIAGMTYFDPYVVEWLTGAAGQQLAATSIGDLERFNAALSADYSGFGAAVADVAGAFSSSDLSDLVSSPVGTVPKSVAVACAWLLVVCEPNGVEALSVHPNATGYAQVAAAFEAVLSVAAAPEPPTRPILPMTGVDPVGLLWVGGAAVVAGAALSVAGRRRRRRPALLAGTAAGRCGREDSNLHPPKGTGT
jgi:lysophospholipase L1-like esterase